jgi:hypothetical protein
MGMQVFKVFRQGKVKEGGKTEQEKRMQVSQNQTLTTFLPTTFKKDSQVDLLGTFLKRQLLSFKRQIFLPASI